MANCVFAFPVWNDPSVSYTPTYSGGSWEATLPLTNLSSRKLHKVARTTDDALASSRLHYDLGVSRDVRLWAIPKHNFSKTGGYVRILAETTSLLFDYEAGDDITYRGGTFTRATTASYVDRNGIVRTATSGVIRDAHFIDGVRHTLLEPARTNLCLRSNDLTNASWSGAATTAAAAGMDGGASSATTVTDDDAAAFENRVQNITIPNDSNPVAVGFWIKKDNDETRFPQIGVGLTGGTAVQLRSSFNTKTGASVSANALGGGGTIRVRDYSDDWWLVEVIVTNNSTGNTTATVAVYPAARTVINGSDNVAAVGSVVVGQVQLEANASFVTSPIFTTTASVTRNADELFFTLPAGLSVPVALTAYLKWHEIGACSDVVDRGIFAITNASDDTPYLVTFFDGNAGTPRIRTTHHNGSSSVASGTAVITNPSIDQVVEARVTLGSDGAVQTHLTFDGGSEASASQSAGLALNAAWAASARIYLNGGIVADGCFAFRSLRIMSGSANSLATMQGAVYDTGWLDAWPSGLDAEEADGINVPFVHVASTNKSHRYGSIQIDDTANADGYVELGRLIVAGGYQPTINMSYGARLGLESDSIRTVTDGGAAVYQEKSVRRTMTLLLENIEEAESFASTFQMQRRLGTSGQLFFVFNPEDGATLMHERSFLCVMRELHGLDFPYHTRARAAFQLVEEL